jgi:hypothetical protein
LSVDAVPADTPRNVKSRFLSPQRRALVFHLLLAVSLLLAQAAAYAHVCSHFKATDPASETSTAASQLCSQCLAGAPLLSAGGVPDFPPVLRAHDSAVQYATIIYARFTGRFHYAFRSRAPPSPL